MAFKLDNDLLDELGLGALPQVEKASMLRHILETLEMRVGTTLANQMSDAQLDEFERLMPVQGDTNEIIQQKEQAALQWLESNFPNYKDVVSNELEKLKNEIRQAAPQILAASQAAGAAQASSMAPQPPLPPASQPQPATAAPQPPQQAYPSQPPTPSVAPPYPSEQPPAGPGGTIHQFPPQYPADGSSQTQPPQAA